MPPTGEPANVLSGPPPQPLDENSVNVLLVEKNDDERERLERILLSYNYRARLGLLLSGPQQYIVNCHYVPPTYAVLE